MYQYVSKVGLRSAIHYRGGNYRDTPMYQSIAQPQVILLFYDIYCSNMENQNYYVIMELLWFH